MKVFIQLLLYCVLILIAYETLGWYDSNGGISGLSDRYGTITPFITGSIQFLVTIIPSIPADFICIAHGSLYGFWIGASLNWLVWWLAAIAEYYAGRLNFKNESSNLERYVSKIPSFFRGKILWLIKLPPDDPRFLIIGRMIPWIGAHITTFYPGIRAVNVRRFLWCSAVGIIPSSLLLALIGTAIPL